MSLPVFKTLLHDCTRILQLFALWLLIAVQGPAAAAPAPAGGLILNQAITTYFNTELGIVESVRSNTVEASVAAVAAIEITGLSDLTLTRGSKDQHYFLVRNIGNVAVSGSFLLNFTGENGVLSDRVLAWDLNGNGLIDHDEPTFRPEDVHEFPAGSVSRMIYSFTVLPSVTIGAEAMTYIEFANGSVRAAVDDAIPVDVSWSGTGLGHVTVVEGTFEIRKSVSRRVQEDGTALIYKLAVVNDSEFIVPGYSLIGKDSLVIDGETRRGILVRDAVPLNTRFAGMGDAGVFEPMYHLAGAAMHTYTTRRPADAGDIDALAWFYEGDFAVGQSVDINFTVLAPSELGGLTVENTGLVVHPGGADFGVVSSNKVLSEVESRETARLEFDDGHGMIGDDTRLTVTGGACNTSDAVDSVRIAVVSNATRDTELVVATETGTNTGIFVTGPLPLLEMVAPVPGDGVMGTRPGDKLIATAQCGDAEMADDLPVNPGNFVFNSVNNDPVAGSVVVLRSADGSEVARVTADARGYFAFGAHPAGRYYIDVLPPYGLAFPSQRLIFDGMSREIHPDAAYGRAFEHPGGMMQVSDMPLDPVYDAAVGLTKAAERERVATGEVVFYTLTAVNMMDEALTVAQIVDRPPYGAELVPGSVAIDGVRHADPARDADGALLFGLGTLRPKQTVEVSYGIRFTPLARRGRNINTAVLNGLQAGTGAPQSAPPVQAVVTLSNDGGVLSREATVIGQVFMDCDGDGLRSGPQEPGVPGVRIITQEGLSVVTDIDGKYSLFGLRPVSHAFVLDQRTLPAGTDVMPTRATDMRRGGSRLVDLKAGELKAERFALDGCTPAAMAEIEARRAAFAERAGNGSDRMGDLPLQPARPEPRSARSEKGVATTSQMRPGDLAETAAAEPEAESVQSLEELVKTLSPQVAFVDLGSETRVKRRSLTLRVKGPADLDLALSLNGAPVAANQIGERTTWDRGNVQALEYVALTLKPGRNVLELVGTDGFDIARGRAQVTIIAPGDPVRIEMIAPKEAPASVGTSVPVVVRVLDAAGLPVDASTMVTLSAHNAEWGATDIRPEQPGVQVYIDNGEATFDLDAPQVSGPDRLEALSAFGKAEARLTWVPDLDERILVGVIEGAVALNGKNLRLEEDGISPFEDTAHGLRGELYLKGRIRGDALLTLRYSSDRDTEDRLFRDINADEYYPVYGDSSERGYDAASGSNLYVKVEKGASYILYGDIAIEPGSDAFKLGGYSRTTTGGKAHWEGDDVSVTVFAARTRQSQKVIEVEGRGVSGPYDLDLANILSGSERIDILVRDRDTGEIIQTLPQRRLADYVLDYFRGAVIFNAPIGQADRDGNPISIRITFETEREGTERYWLYGGEVLWNPSDRTELGLRVIHADAERMTADRERIIAGFLRQRIGERTSLEAEVARAEDGNGIVGHAARVKLVHQGRTGKLTIEAAHADREFAPTGSSVQAGTDRLAATYETQLDEDRRLVAQAEYIRDAVAGRKLLRAEARQETRIDAHTLVRAGLRFEHDMEADGDANTLFGLLGATWAPSPDRPLTFGIDFVTPALGNADGYVRMSAQYQFSPKLRLDFGGEIALDGESSAQTPTHLHVALDYTLNDYLTGRTELVGDGDGLNDTRIIQGMRAAWNLNRTTELSFGIEHSQDLGSDAGWLTSAAFGVNWASEDGRWIGELDLEQTRDQDGRTWFVNAGLAGDISPDVTFLARSRHAVDDRGTGAQRVRHRTRIGAAYRPAEDPRLAVLAWYERRFEKQDTRRDTHMWSVAANYEATADLEIRGKYAGQAENLSGAGFSDSSVTQLLQAGLDWDFADDRFRLGLQASRIWDDKGFSTNAYGIELGMVVDEGAMVTLGYNHVADSGIGRSDLFDEGIYVRVRLLLDNSLWDRLDNWFAN